MPIRGGEQDRERESDGDNGGGLFAAQIEKAAEGARAWFPPTLVQLYDNNYGLALIALAQFFFSCMSMSVKYLLETTKMSTLTLIFVRMGITGLCCWTTLLLQRDPHPFLGPPGIRRLLCLRGFAGFMGLLCAYQALRGLSLSDAVTIGFLAPSFTAFFGWLVLHESFGLREAVSGVVSLFGVVLISRPAFLFGKHDDTTPILEQHEWASARVKGPVDPAVLEEGATARVIGATWALVGAIFSATAYLTIRYIGTKANALHSIGYFSMACTIASGFAMIVAPGQLEWPNDRRGFALIGVIGVFGFLAQTLLTFGLQNEKAGRAGLAMYLQIFFAVILELLVFHTLPSFLSLVGTTIILSSAAWVAMSTLKTKPPPVSDDPESNPISRTSSPIPELGTKAVRGEHYHYSSLPTDEPSDIPDLPRVGNSPIQKLGVNRPLTRRSSTSTGTPI